jgi:hypothetical protein
MGARSIAPKGPRFQLLELLAYLPAMAGPSPVQPHVDLYSSMAPQPERSEGLAMLREGIASTRKARRTWGYFGLRVSALLLGTAGFVAPVFAERIGVPEVGRFFVLPVLVYATLALGLGGTLELIRIRRERYGRSWFLFIFLFMGLMALVTNAAPALAPHVPEEWRELLPLFLILLGMPLINRLTQRRPKQTSKAAEQKPKEEPRSSKWSVEALAPRALGVFIALSLLTLVGVLPGFIRAEMTATPLRDLPLGLSGPVHATLFVLVLSAALAIHGAVAERLWPRWPRLAFFVLVLAPYGLSYLIPGFPNCIDAFAGYLSWLEGHFAPPFWSV